MRQDGNMGVGDRGSAARGQGTGVRGQRPRSGIQHSSFIIHHSGFTLVELLVVIVIISIMVGLLLPAVQAARGRARITQCSNNQHELALAIQGYDVAKNHLPGYANTVGGNKVSWIPVLFPFIGRMDLWEGDSAASPAINGWRTGSPRTGTGNGTNLNPTSTAATGGVVVRINTLVCPNDSQMGVATPLSYVVNAGYAALGPATDILANQNGVFRNLTLANATPTTMSSIPSPSQRPMLSECTYPIGVASPAADRQWSDLYNGSGTDNVLAYRLGFNFVRTGVRLADTELVSAYFLPPPSPQQTAIHRGIVIITFCDGHTDSVSDDATCNTYDYSPLK
jgi:prepilin-type N-terminal cleavage/methylation domain-containing protein